MMKVPEAAECEVCSGILGVADGLPSGGGSSHSCLKTLIYCIKRNADVIQDQQNTIRSQSTLLADLLHEMESVKQCLNDKKQQITCLEEKLDKVILNHASTVAEPEHKGLIDRLKEDGFITSDKVYQIMLSVDFRDFSQDNTTPGKR